MREPYAYWGHVPVEVISLSGDFIREFVTGSHTVPATIRPDGVWDFTKAGIVLETDPQWNAMPEWHEKQARYAIDAAVEEYGGRLSVIPTKGFVINVTRNWSPGVSVYRAGEMPAPPKPTSTSSVTLWEDLSGIEHPKRIPDARPVLDCNDFRGTECIGTDFNPYPKLFAEFVAKLPEAWNRWLESRRLKRWKPVAEWLVTLRAEERKAKRQKKLNAKTST